MPQPSGPYLLSPLDFPILTDPKVVVFPEGRLRSLKAVLKTPETPSRTAFQNQERSVTSFNSTVFQLASGPTLRVWSQAWENPEGRLNAGFSATFPLLGWSYGR